MSDEPDQPSDRSAPEPVSPDPLEPGAAEEPTSVERENTPDGPLDTDPSPGHLPSETGVQAERQSLDDDGDDT